MSHFHTQEEIDRQAGAEQRRKERTRHRQQTFKPQMSDVASAANAALLGGPRRSSLTPASHAHD